MTKEKKPMQRRYTKKKAVRSERLLRLPPDLNEEFIAFATEDGDSVTDLIITAMRKYADERKRG